MKEQFLSFRKSIHQEIIKEISDVLTENNIENFLTDDSKIFDPSFANNEVNNEFSVKIKQSDFVKANQIISDYYTESVEIPEDYYLNEYDDEELTEIIFQQEEWNEVDIVIAKKILRQRGIQLPEEQINNENREHLQRIKSNYDDPKKVETLLIFGYFFAVFGALISYFHWVALTISYIIAILILTLRKQLSNGERIHFFNENDRKHGVYIMLISIGTTLFWFIIVARSFF